MKKVAIVHLYPKELNLYGDGGNVRCLYHRLVRRGFRAEVQEVDIGDKIPAFDLLFIGGGQDREMRIIAKDLHRKSEMLSYAVQSGKTVLAICGGFQLLGNAYTLYSGEVLRLTGALPFETLGGAKRMVGNMVFETPFGKVVGFENHSGKTYLSPSLTPLGKVLVGGGNNGEDGGEGVLFQNTFGTYAHGPVLPKNPALADELLKRALHQTELAPLDDEAENRCHADLISRFC